MKKNTNESKRQHYIPQTYLKYFSLKKDNKYFINALPKDSHDTNDIKELNIKNVCLENNIYTLPSVNIEERMILEKFFSNEVESQYDNIYKILVDPNKNYITEEERAKIITTVVTMFFRTSVWKNTINEIRSKSFEKSYLMCQQYNKEHFYYGDIKISIKGKTLDELQNEYKIKKNPLFLLTQLKAMDYLFETRFKKDDICIIRNETENDFITSDNPVIAFNKMIIAPIDPNNTMILPIDNKHILWLLPNNNLIGRNILFRRKTPHHKEVIEYNSMQKNNCERFVFGSISALSNSNF